MRFLRRRPGEDELDRAIRHFGYAVTAFGIAVICFLGAVVFYIVTHRR